MNPEILPTRLKAGTPGLGHASGFDIARRAEELAISDGRGAYTDADLVRAAAELSGGETLPAAPEVVAAMEQVSTWDDPPAQAGHRVPSTPLDDEGNIAEQLIQDGVQEAEHDRRVAAEEEERD